MRLTSGLTRRVTLDVSTLGRAVPFSRPEHAACGVGFVASTDGEPRRAHLDRALAALACVEHRGGSQADGRTSDGAGVMTEIPFAVFGYEPGSVAVASLFLPPVAARRRAVIETLESVFEGEGIRVLDQRAVPIDTSVLGRMARDTLPSLLHLVLERPEFCRTEGSFRTRLYHTKQALRTRLAKSAIGREVFFVSLSTRTMVYKALVPGAELAAFYPDLADPRFATRFALFHRRFSTNTTTSWDRAQPFRLIAHNGEINTIACNRAWALSREQALGLPKDELLTHEGISDSGSLNEMVEALRFRSSIPHLSEALAIMMPPAGTSPSGADGRRSAPFYEFWSRAVEPWDGPAFLAYSDGDVVGARLDRNGFRPCRWARTRDAFYLASEAGIFELDEAEVAARGTLQGGSGAHVDLTSGVVHFTDPSESRENKNASFDPRLLPIGRHPAPELEGLDRRATLFGVGREELDDVLVPMAASGKEPIGSMGDTAALAFLSDEPRSLFDFFFQTFAQVTNPPMDAIRERTNADLTTYLGRRPNIFAPKTLLPLTPGLELRSPVLDPGGLAAVRGAWAEGLDGACFESVEVPITFPRALGPEGLERGLEVVAERTLDAIRGGCSIIVLSDRSANEARPPIPSLLALRAAARAMTEAGHRLDASLVVDTADVRSVHQLAALVGFGAAAVCPHLAFALVESSADPRLAALDAEARRDRLRSAFEAGLLKVMSKMGISSTQGYHDAQLFTALGLGAGLMTAWFPGVPSPLGGLELVDLATAILERTEGADTSDAPLPVTHLLREHNKGLRGERHSMTARLSRLVHAVTEAEEGAARDLAWQRYLEAAALSRPTSPRHLLRPRREGPALPLDDVQPRAEILRRFGSGAMSFGAISAESQRDLIRAMARVGGRSGSGEGGENPYFYLDGTSASTKQIASGRFGVTAEYLVSGEEIEIKMAQGAKPGEGGQLMAAKVDAEIARARHAPLGVDLISPPPQHDIYSIEDLRELIHELKQLRPGVPVVVKLVSGVNVGTIAAGVVKAGADVVQISGGDGGTGAASLSSMKHAGLPWELGLAEAHAALVAQQLREHVVLRVDGGLSTGRDIVVAAMLGAEGFGFGKLLLVAEGCIMARVCEKNTCPRGIATHDPKYKAKYRGTEDAVVRWLEALADDVRRELAALGVSRLEELVGRADRLEPDPAHAERIRSRRLDLALLCSARPHPRGHRGPLLREPTSRLNQRLLEDAAPALDGGRVRLGAAIRSTDRAALATLSGAIAARTVADRRRAARAGDAAGVAAPWQLEEGAIRVELEGSAGQGFAAFLVRGLDVRLEGEANDGVAKSMSGGRVVIVPPRTARYAAAEQALIGNCALYGATGGVLYAHGRAGDRFAVRSSGATAVVEGVGLHACEYMTNGVVVILGEASHNVGAGMTGGVIYLPARVEARLNLEYVEARPLDAEDEARLRPLLGDYADATGSLAARRLLEAWPESMRTLRRVEPRGASRAAALRVA